MTSLLHLSLKTTEAEQPLERVLKSERSVTMLKESKTSVQEFVLE